MMLKERNTLLLEILKKKDYYIKIINLNQFIFMTVIKIFSKTFQNNYFFTEKEIK